GEAKETIATGTRAAARGGFTTVCCMPNTTPPIDSAAAVNTVKEIAEREASVRVLPIGCVSAGRQGEALAELNVMAGAGAVGFSDDGSPVLNPQLMQQALAFSQKSGLPIIDHCEAPGHAPGGVAHDGKVAVELGLLGIPSTVEETMVSRDISLAQQIPGAHLHIAHTSTAGTVELLRRGKEHSSGITAEVTPHHLTLTDEIIRKAGTQAKVNPPLRTQKDITALIQGLKDGIIDIIATDHAPHTTADKNCSFAEAAFGISGLETAFGALMSLVHDGYITLLELIKFLTINPAKILGNSALGTLKPGAWADIVIFDPEKTWTVNPEDFASKGKNTPLAGKKLRGKIMVTIYNGKFVYKDNSL
ncbi:dihydroorotase, partial [Chloroflexota bacterium]